MNELSVIRTCSVCGEIKPLSEFYRSIKLKHRFLSKCISCRNEQQRMEYHTKAKDLVWLYQERKRNREKYHRLNYKEKQKLQDKDHNKKYLEKYPEKYTAIKLSHPIKSVNGQQKHHWSYNFEHCKDVIFLTIEEHKKAHRFMIYDQERMMFKTLSGELLDNKLSHMNYIDQIIRTNE